MKCDKNDYDAIACNDILNSCEELILEDGILSFNHTNVIKKEICSSRKLYKYFSSREEIVICLLLRRTVAYEIENFLKSHYDLPTITKLFVPSLMTFEVSRIDPIYQKACLMATNIGVWQVAHEAKQKKLETAEHRYIATIHDVVNLAIENGDLLPDCLPYISRDIYLYNMGKLLSLGSIISKDDTIKPLNTNDANSLIALTGHYMIKKNITPNLLLRLNDKVCSYLSQGRNISCDRCHYFKLER